MSDDNRPLIFIGAAVLCLLLFGVAFKTFRSSSSSEEAARQEADRVAAVSGRSGRSDWSTQEGGLAPGSTSGSRAAANGGASGVKSGDDPEHDGSGGNGAGAGSAAVVREQLRRSSQQAAVAAASGPSLKVDSAAPSAIGGARGSAFAGTRGGVGSELLGNAPQPGAAAVAPAPVAVDPNGKPLPIYQADESHVFNTDADAAIAGAGAMTSTAGSIAFEVKPGWVPGDGSGATFFGMGGRGPNDSRMDLTKNGDMLNFVIRDSQGKETQIGALIRDWQPDQSHAIAVTWGADENGQKMMSLYDNGALVDRSPYPNDINLRADQALVVGNGADRNHVAPSQLNGLQVYNQALDSSHIGSLSFGKQQ